MRVHLKGVHRVEMRLATGKTRTYYYAWRGGPRIDARPGTPDFVRCYQEAHASLRRPKAGTMMTLIAAFKASAEFRALAPSTLRAYSNYIQLIEAEFGDFPSPHLMTAGSAASSRLGATGSPIPHARRTTLGPRWREFCRSARIAVSLAPILAKAAAASTPPAEPTSFGGTTIWLSS